MSSLAEAPRLPPAAAGLQGMVEQYHCNCSAQCMAANGSLLRLRDVQSGLLRDSKAAIGSSWSARYGGAVPLKLFHTMHGRRW